jgi:hypothetical protein
MSSSSSASATSQPVDLFDRRIIGRLSRQLPLASGEELLDFEIGTTRPFGYLPAPFPNQFPENARVEMAVSDRALYFRVQSKSYKGDTARIPWDRVATFGIHKGEGKWKRWSLKGELANGETIQVSLLGRPRPSMLTTLARLVDPVADAPE